MRLLKVNQSVQKHIRFWKFFSMTNKFIQATEIWLAKKFVIMDNKFYERRPWSTHHIDPVENPSLGQHPVRDRAVSARELWPFTWRERDWEESKMYSLISGIILQIHAPMFSKARYTPMRFHCNVICCNYRLNLSQKLIIYQIPYLPKCIVLNLLCLKFDL